MKIVFTSCMDAERVADQEIWRRIAEHEQPDVLMLLGDQIYMDWGLGPGVKNWRSLIAREPVDGLRAYAVDMHRRYGLQWGVQAFRELVCGFAGRADAGRLLLTWDDHDYAWNNSLGVDGADEAHRHGVPPQVKAVSRRLFAQFAHQLRTAGADAAYPPLPADWNAPLAAEMGDLFWSGPLGGAGGPPALLLDTRWYRQARAEGASILGGAQAGALQAQVQQGGAGLLVVAGGTPMAHHYLLSQQGWHAEGQPSYVEYDATVKAARRPVLYLAGEIHANAWGGRLPATDGTHGRVVQLLSSGAALGSFGPKRFAPAYGTVDIPDSWATGGTVQARLWSQSRSGAWQADPPLPPLEFDANDWLQPLEGQAVSHIELVADDQPMALFAARQRTAGYRGRTRVNLPGGPDALDGLDGVYTDAPLPDGKYAEPLHWRVAVPGGALSIEGEADIGRPDDWPAATQRLVRAAFERALARPDKASVVLFVHGFGKSPAMAVAQACGLRASYPGCEPVLYTWEAGRAGGPLAALAGLAQARQAAQDGSLALATVLHAFDVVAADPRYARLAKVVLARSAGCLALHHALERTGVGGLPLGHVDRIVLSAPLLKAAQYRRPASFGGLQRPVVVTRNQRDQTLRFADWFDGVGPLLGLEEGFAPEHADQVCLDFSDSAGVGSLHDYLLLRINPRQQALHEWLLYRRQLSWPDAVSQGLATPGAPGVLHVP